MGSDRRFSRWAIRYSDRLLHRLQKGLNLGSLLNGRMTPIPRYGPSPVHGDGFESHIISVHSLRALFSSPYCYFEGCGNGIKNMATASQYCYLTFVPATVNLKR